MTPETPPQGREAIRQNNRKINRRSTWLAVGAIVVLSGLSYLVARNSLKSWEEVPKSTGVVAPPMVLQAFQHFPDGHFEVIDRLPSQGSEVAFKLSTTRPVHTALCASLDQRPPVVVFEGAKIAPGPDRILEKEDHLFTYLVKPTDHDIKFCLLYANDREHLVNQFADLQSNWNNAAKEACVELHG